MAKTKVTKEEQLNDLWWVYEEIKSVLNESTYQLRKKPPTEAGQPFIVLTLRQLFTDAKYADRLAQVPNALRGMWGALEELKKQREALGEVVESTYTMRVYTPEEMAEFERQRLLRDGMRQKVKQFKRGDMRFMHEIGAEILQAVLTTEELELVQDTRI